MVVFVIDGERVKGLEEVKRTLTTYGFTVKELKALGSRAAKLILARGGKTVKLYVAFSGRSKSIEGDLEELLESLDIG